MKTLDDFRGADTNQAMDNSQKASSNFEAYWKSYLAGSESAVFPALPTCDRQPVADKTLDFDIVINDCHSSHEIGWIIRGALAILISQYTGYTDVIFGVVTPHLNFASDGNQETLESTNAILPVRVCVQKDQLVRDYLDMIQQQAKKMMSFQQTHLRQIAAISEETRNASNFQTLLIIDTKDKMDDILMAWEKIPSSRSFNTCALTLQCLLKNNSVKLRASFDTSVLDEWTMGNMMRQLGFIIKDLSDAPNGRSLEEVSAITAQDMALIGNWNASVPETITKNVCQFLEEHVQRNPDAPAVCTRDEELTYSELDDLSSRLACHLAHEYHVGPETFVALLFEKSIWAVVAMVGVLKAGGCLLPLDPTQAHERRNNIMDQTKTNLVLASVSYQDTLMLKCVSFAVGRDSLASLDKLNEQNVLSRAKPTSAAYILFTSGSTGQPKGIIQENQSLLTASFSIGETFNFSPSSRVLQFSSYTFDVCLGEIFSTLFNGGCICVPSEQERLEDLTGSIMAMAVNTAILTPTVARMIQRDKVPKLSTLILCGEAVTPVDFDQWYGLSLFFNGYGPTETNFCTGCHYDDSTKADNIGKGMGCVTWIVDPSDHNKLMPLGAIGELLIEGPIVARGYLDNPEKTAEAFVKDVPWLPKRGRHGCLYKTGDLVRYNHDGSITFISRKDTQVKIRGQRVELGEVEYHVRECASFAREVIAEVITPRGQAGKAFLAIFMTTTGGEQEYYTHSSTSRLLQLADGLELIPVQRQIEAALSQRVPRYMIPELYFRVDRLPLTLTGKVNRKHLRAMGSAISTQQLIGIKHNDIDAEDEGSFRLQTEAERRLRDLWAEQLGIGAHSIGANDNFFRLGGDSIMAMKLVGAARKASISLLVANIFQHPVLAAQAQTITLTKASEPSVKTIGPFDLLNDCHGDAKDFRQELSTLCQVDASLVEDAFPCTPLQEGLMSLSVQRDGSYVLRASLKLSKDIKLPAFKAAWGEVIHRIPLLRTRIVHHNRLGLVQVVCKQPTRWLHASSIDNYLEVDKSTPMALGNSLSRFALIEVDGDENTSHTLIWSIHHAVYDGWSMSIIMNLVRATYERNIAGRNVRHMIGSPPGFNSFIEYLERYQLTDSNSYWHSYLADSEFSPFPVLPPSLQEPRGDEVLELILPITEGVNADVTTATSIRGALAILLHQYTGNDDVIFGAIVTGRNAPVAGIEDIAGPTIATVPIRIRVQDEDDVQEYLQSIQRQATEMIDFEHVGLARIAKISEDCQRACSFQTLLVIQPQEDIPETSNWFGEWQELSEQAAFNTYALTLECFLLGKSHIKIKASYDATIIDTWKMEKMLQHFGNILKRLLKRNPGQRVQEMNRITTDEKAILWQWNHPSAAVVDQCIHNMICKHAKSQPDALSISSWDGELTYRELDKFSTQLGSYLNKYSVGPEVIVPLCFEKSLWTVVAILGVLKAGGAFVLLDPSLPKARLEKICHKIQAKVALISPRCEGLLPFVPNNITLSHETVDWLSLEDEAVVSQNIANVRPDNAAYIIFTSGSTGEPKGCVIEHRSYCSAAVGHGASMNMSSATRTLQFGSYSFAGAIMEILMTLIYGGCICIPSDEERGNLTQAINRLKANWAFLTPTVLGSVRQQDVPSLHTICVGGERIYLSQIQEWAPDVHLRQTYGSSETSAVVSSARLTVLSAPTEVGKAATGRYWIVDPADLNRLMPIGTPGEIIIEGPTIGREYLEDREKTAAAFIDAPAWRSSFGPFSGSKFYRTGDMAAYDMNGSIQLLGRKDTQVKLRGQRIEIGEIECQAKLAAGEILEVVVEIAVLNYGISKSPSLVCFVRLQADGYAGVCDPVKRVRDHLETVLPAYMVPSVFIPVESLPRTPSGKTDRRELRAIASALSTQEITHLKTSLQEVKRSPRTETEIRLRELWAQVLNLKEENIGIDDSFFHVGGDSIIAMQLSSAARVSLGNISMMDILQEKTISRLAVTMALKGSSDFFSVGNVENVHQPFQLSPVQQLYMLLEPNPSRCFDQGFYVKLRSYVSYDALASAMETVVSRHPMLRARYSRTENGWDQRIVSDIPGSFHISEVHAQDSSDRTQGIRHCRELLDIKDGPVFSGVLLHNLEFQTLYITAHHLVVDLVSWRIILHELQELVNVGQISIAPTMSFQSWTTMQSKYAADLSSWTYKAQAPLLSFWGIDANDVVEGATASNRFALDEIVTAAILGSCNTAFNTRPLELLAAALVYSFYTVFSERPLPDIFTEGHGREAWNDEIDVSHTVGWFTTIFPIHVEIESNSDASLLDTVRSVKDWVRELSQNGWSHFTSQFADSDQAKVNAAQFPVEILLNFVGSFQQLERDDSLFENLALLTGCEPKSYFGLRRFAIFQVEAQTDMGCLSVTIDYPQKLFHHDKITLWTKRYQATLQRLTVLLQRQAEWTLADFPLVFKSYESITEFQNRVFPQLGLTGTKDIEDIYPCSPVQENILNAQEKDSNNYRSVMNFEMTSSHAKIDIMKIKEAWRAVVRKHQLLRAVFVKNESRSPGMITVILKYREPEVSLKEMDVAILAKDRLVGLLPVSYTKHGLQHHLSINPIDGKRAHLSLEINHAIFDAHSISNILIRDFQSAYNGDLDLGGPIYRDFIGYIYEGTRKEINGSFWMNHLKYIKPTLLSFTTGHDELEKAMFTMNLENIEADNLHQFCADAEVTLATLIQTAWARVLHHYTGSQAPCFGVMATGRDIPLKGVGEIFGLFTNVIPFQVRLDTNLSMIKTIQKTQGAYINSLQYQSYPLGQVYEALNIDTSGLFNTVLSIEKQITESVRYGQPCSLRYIGGQDPVEFSIAVEVFYNSQQIDISIQFRENYISRLEARKICNTLYEAIQNILNS